MVISKRPSHGRPSHHWWDHVVLAILVMLALVIVASF